MDNYSLEFSNIYTIFICLFQNETQAMFRQFSLPTVPSVAVTFGQPDTSERHITDLLYLEAFALSDDARNFTVSIQTNSTLICQNLCKHKLI